MKENFKKESPILSLPSLGGGANGPSVAGGGAAGGQDAYTTAGTYTWTCPVGVTSVSVVCIGAGGTQGSMSYGPDGGSLVYKNNISVTPGQNYTIVVGQTNTTPNGNGGYAGDSSAFGTIAYGGATQRQSTRAAGVNFDGGGVGGRGGIDYYSGATGYVGGGGGGAAGYSGNGGAGSYGPNGGGNGSGGGGGGGGVYAGSYGNPAGGGGTGILGEGSSGAGGIYTTTVADTVGHGGSGGTDSQPAPTGAYYGGPQDVYGGNYGGGSGIKWYQYSSAPVNTSAQNGAVRIIYPGDVRQFPSTRTADE
tara:strand:+ start:666 stop:1583 length:918 start_codon:yes stop_codon:yes gene_type:complete